MKKSIFEKIGLIESVPSQDDSAYDLEPGVESVVPESVESTTSLDGSQIIAEVYESNSMSDMSQSVYKVEELLATLPPEMPEKTSKGIVLNLLKTMHIEPDSIVNDSTSRVEILRAVEDDVAAKAKAEIANRESDIEALKAKIEEDTAAIQAAETRIKDVRNAFGDEITRIGKLIEFIGGDMNAAQ